MENKMPKSKDKETIKFKKINSCRKGKNFEREICKELKNIFKVDFFRTAYSGAYATIHKNKGNLNEQIGDITYDRNKLNWVDIIECKHYKSLNILYDLLNKKSHVSCWIEKLNNNNLFSWILFIKSNNKKIICITNKENILINKGELYAIIKIKYYNDNLYLGTIDCIRNINDNNNQ